MIRGRSTIPRGVGTGMHYIKRWSTWIGALAIACALRTTQVALHEHRSVGGLLSFATRTVVAVGILYAIARCAEHQMGSDPEMIDVEPLWGQIQE